LVPGAPFVITLIFWNTSREPITLNGDDCHFEVDREWLWGFFHLTDLRIPEPGDRVQVVLPPGSKKEIRIEQAWILWQNPFDSLWGRNLGMDLATVLRKGSGRLRLHLQYAADGQRWDAEVNPIEITVAAPPPLR
jgi:hypothetical protein